MTSQIRISANAQTFRRWRAAWAHLGNARALPVTALTPIPGITLPGSLTVTGVEILSAIGRSCTRPDDPHGPASLFALLRYAEALDAHQSVSLSSGVVSMDSHKKSVLSDEFGCGAAMLLAERCLGVRHLLDVETAIAQGRLRTTAPRSRRPDYAGALVGSHPSRLLLLEAKGTVSGRHHAVRQVQDGCRQVRGVAPEGAWAGLPVVRVVSAVSLRRTDQTSRTELLVDDPEDVPADKFHLDGELAQVASHLHYLRLATLIGDAELLHALSVSADRTSPGVDMGTLPFGGDTYVGTEIAVTCASGELTLFAGIRESVRNELIRAPLTRTPQLESQSVDAGDPERAAASLSSDGFLVLLQRNT